MLIQINSAFAHEPIFGLGPHVIYKGGVGIEVEIDGERSSGNQKTERELAIDTEIIYGITSDLAATLVIPGILDKVEKTETEDQSSSGFGDLSLRLKYRFWRRDSPGAQDSAAIILGGKFPTGNENEKPKLGSGSTDFLFGLEADVFRALARRCQEDLWRRRMRVFLEEVVLHLPRVVVAEAIRQLELIERVLQQVEFRIDRPRPR